MASVKIDVQQIRQNTTTLYQFALTRQLLVSLKGIIGNIYYNPRTMTGTQRTCSDERRGDLARFISNTENILPTTLLFNARKAINGKPTNLPQKLQFKGLTPGGRFGTITLDTEDTFISITDGSGRYHGYCDIVDELEHDFELSCLIMAADADNENFHFLVINELQSRMPKDMTFDSLSRMDNDMDPERISTLPHRQRKLAERAGRARPIFQMLLENNSGPFTGNVLYENMSLANNESVGDYKLHRLGEVFSKSPDGIVINKSRFFPYDDDPQTDARNKAILLSNFFQALDLKIPGAFLAEDNKYAITDSNSLYILERFLRELFELDPGLRGTVPPTSTFLGYLHGTKRMLPKFWERMPPLDASRQRDHVSRYHGMGNLNTLGKEMATEAFKGYRRRSLAS